MDPVFIYYDKVKFQNEYKIFNINFSDGDNLQADFFKKNRDCYITSMSCFITILQDLTELNHYEDIKKISEICNKNLKNGVEHLYEKKKLEVTFDNSNLEFLPEKSNRGLSLQAVEYFYYVTKRKGLVFVYSPYEELEILGLKFENKKKGHINGYSIQMKEENNKIYLEKELFFNKNFFRQTNRRKR